MVSSRNPPPAEQADDQGNSGHRQSDRSHTLQRGFLQSASDGVEQHPDRSGVLHDDRGGNVCPLNCQIIEIVGRGDTQNADQVELAEVPGGKAQAPALPGAAQR